MENGLIPIEEVKLIKRSIDKSQKEDLRRSRNETIRLTFPFPNGSIGPSGSGDGR